MIRISSVASSRTSCFARVHDEPAVNPPSVSSGESLDFPENLLFDFYYDASKETGVGSSYHVCIGVPMFLELVSQCSVQQGARNRLE